MNTSVRRKRILPMRVSYPDEHGNFIACDSPLKETERVRIEIRTTTVIGNRRRLKSSEKSIAKKAIEFEKRNCDTKNF